MTISDKIIFAVFVMAVLATTAAILGMAYQHEKDMKEYDRETERRRHPKRNR